MPTNGTADLARGKLFKLAIASSLEEFKEQCSKSDVKIALQAEVPPEMYWVAANRAQSADRALRRQVLYDLLPVYMPDQDQASWWADYQAESAGRRSVAATERHASATAQLRGELSAKSAKLDKALSLLEAMAQASGNAELLEQFAALRDADNAS